MGAPTTIHGSTISTVLALSSSLRAFVGVGALSLPASLLAGGIAPFIILLIFFSYVACYCIIRLVDCSEIIQLNEAKRNMYRRRLRTIQLTSKTSLQEEDIMLFDDYPELLSDSSTVPYDEITAEDRDKVTVPTFREVGACAYSTAGAVAVDFGIIGTQVGTAIAYSIFISNSLHEVFPVLSRVEWLAVIYIPLLFIAQVRDVSKLAPIATLGNIVYICTLVVFFYTGYTRYCCENNVMDLNIVTYSKITTIFGTLAFALAGSAMILPIKANMTYPQSFSMMISITFLLIFFIYFAIGFFGYFLFGEHTQPSILSNLTYGLSSKVVKLMLSACLYFSYALQHYPIALLCDTMLDKYWFNLPSDTAHISHHPENILDIIDETTALNRINDIINSKQRWILQTLARAGSVTFCCAIAWMFPQIHLIMALFGSMSNSLLAYILPALFYLRICRYPLIYKNHYFPYNREGEPNPYPITFESATKINYNTNSEVLSLQKTQSYGSIDRPGIATNNSSYMHLFRGIENDEAKPLMGNNKRQHAIKPYSLNLFNTYVFKISAFPYFVSILGIGASIIGITVAIKDLIGAYG